MLIAGALFVGSYGIGQAYRSDEVWSLRAVAMPWDAMMDELRDDIHPPLYYWMLRFWTGMMGTGEMAARMISLLLGLLAAAVVYFSGKEWFGARGALLAAAVIGTSPLLVVAEQFVRMYALLTLASAVSTAMYLRLSLGERERGADWALYVAANVAGSFTHVWFFFLLFAQGAAHLALRRASRLGWMAGAAALSLLPYGLYWLPVLMRQIRKTDRALAWASTPGLDDALTALGLLGWLWWIAVPVLWRARPRETGGVRLACTLIAALTLIVPFAISFWKPIFWPRFTVVALPALAMAIGSLAPDEEFVRLEPALLGAVCWVAFPLVTFYATECDSRAGAAFLKSNARPGDLVVFTNISRPAIDHYWKDSKIPARSYPRENDAHPGFDGPAPQALLDSEAGEIVSGAKRVIVFHGFRPAKEAPLLGRLRQTMHRVDELCRQCVGMGGYYNRISVFEAR